MHARRARLDASSRQTCACHHKHPLTRLWRERIDIWRDDELEELVMPYNGCEGMAVTIAKVHLHLVLAFVNILLYR
jgi:hypothetical protein